MIQPVVNFPRAAAIFAISALSILSVRADVLYETDFENFTPGADNLSGTEGWVATIEGQSLSGIDNEILSGLGNSAYLGFFKPASNLTRFVTVFTRLNFDGITSGKPIIEFEALIGIADSQDNAETPLIDESLRKDRFSISIYNTPGVLLASVIYDNRTNTYGIYRYNGSSDPFDTGFEFVIEEPQFLYFRIDLENNTWSASLDGAPLFTDSVFTSTAGERSIGTIAAEWAITNRFNPGNNWMLFDDWLVTAKASTPATSAEPFEITKVERTVDQRVELTYPADKGCTYTVQYSSDLKSWIDLPNSPVVAPQTDPLAKHTDETPAASQELYYRILRTAAD